MIAPPLNQRYCGGKTALALHASGKWTCKRQHVSFIQAELFDSALDGSDPSDRHARKPLQRSPSSLTLSAWCAIRCIAKRHPDDAEVSIRALVISTARGADTTHFTSRLNARLASTSHRRTKVTAPFAGLQPPTCRAICARSRAPTLPEVCREG